jgi:hypothetical protein
MRLCGRRDYRRLNKRRRENVGYSRLRPLAPPVQGSPRRSRWVEVPFRSNRSTLNLCRRRSQFPHELETQISSCPSARYGGAAVVFRPESSESVIPSCSIDFDGDDGQSGRRLSSRYPSWSSPRRIRSQTQPCPWLTWRTE